MTTPLTVAEALAQAANQINTRRPLPAILQELVSMARRSIPGVDHVGISVTHAGGGIETMAWTDDLVLRLDTLQYELGEGPCLSAIRAEQVVVVNRAESDQRWPRFMKEAVRLGLRSQLGLRLYADHDAVGGLNLYSTRDGQISPDVVHIAQLFASHAALALGKARLEEELIEAMGTRQRIGVALGILMERYDLDEDRAFQYLARTSESAQAKAHEIAEELVDRANHSNSLPLDRPTELP